MSSHRVLDSIKRVTKQGPPVLPKAETPPEIVSRLTASPFQIDHRGELIAEMRADADILDKRAAEQTALALSLRLAADHLDANPPEP
jgi:hypothetical protein